MDKFAYEQVLKYFDEISPNKFAVSYIIISLVAY
jgi:hypothetical protein